MKKILLLTLLPLYSFAQVNSPNVAIYLNTLKATSDDPALVYNVFKYGNEILLLRDTQSFQPQSMKATPYLKNWKDLNRFSEEGEDFFLLDKNMRRVEKSSARDYLDLKTTLKMQYEGMGGETFTIKRRKKHPGSLQSIEEDEVLFVAKIYECTNKHDGSPHSGTDKEKLKKDHGCTNFHAKFL